MIKEMAEHKSGFHQTVMDNLIPELSLCFIRALIHINQAPGNHFTSYISLNYLKGEERLIGSMEHYEAFCSSGELLTNLVTTRVC